MSPASNRGKDNNRLSTEVLIRNSVFWIPALASLLYVSLGTPGLPEKYRWDSAVIQQATLGTREVDGAYQFIANFYSVLSLASTPWLSAIASLIPFLAIQAYVYFKFAPKAVTLNITIFIVSLDVLAAVYFGQMTKELFMLILPISFLVSFHFQRFPKTSIVIPALLISGLMRPYWLIVLSLFAMSYVLSLRVKKINPLHISTLLVAAFYVLPIYFSYSQHYELEEIRSGLNLARLDSDVAQTAITAPLDFRQPELQFLNLVWVFSCFVVPIPLLLTSKMIHVVFAGFIFYLAMVVISTINFWNSKAMDDYIFLASHLMLSYIITQAIFEPDFGSFLRHLTPLLLLGLFLFLAKEKLRLSDRVNL
jgi:hypothetical protein